MGQVKIGLLQIVWNLSKEADAELNRTCQRTQSHQSADTRLLIVAQQFRQLLKFRLGQYFIREIGLDQDTQIQINISQTIKLNGSGLNDRSVGMDQRMLIIEGAQHIPALRPEKLQAMGAQRTYARGPAHRRTGR